MENENLEVQESVAVATESDGKDYREYVYENRRYVGLKETIWYVVYDMCQSFNIDSFNDRFVTNILQIDLDFQTIVRVVNGFWDVINDIFTAAIVEKTRTRWGKFKPYLVALGIPGTLGTCFYWLMPMIFKGKGARDMSKFLTYFILAIVREGAGTFRTIARTGMLATITPHPVDRTRLITMAEFVSGALGEKLPQQVLTVLLDLIGNKVINLSYTSTFMVMGNFTSIVAGVAALVFCVMTRERVMQSIETPSVIQGIKSVINNKPILLLTLSETLSNFSVGGSINDYYIDVLNFASMTMVAGIPGAIINPFSFYFVPWFRRRFSTKTLYLVSTKIQPILDIPVYLIGMIGGKHNGIYKKVLPMFFVMAIKEMIFMVFWGVRRVIPSEMYNEAMDYCEWKNGYRTEAMTSVAKDLTTKLASILNSSLSLQLKKLIGYDISSYTQGQAQTDDTKHGLFAMATIIPTVTGLLGIIPILFYDLSGEKRERMYAELLVRREQTAAKAADATAEELKALGKEQMEIGTQKKSL
ncbi:MAG: MFS transporter [Ruminococcaceae bacterium]|nr:MFS transporter [Oscillospiraceae bacterium]